MVVGTLVGGVVAKREWEKSIEALHIGNTKKEIEKVFDQLDVDKSGSLSKKELQAGLRAAGLKAYDYQINELFSMADQDGNGELSKAEWDEIVLKIKHISPDKDFHDVVQRPAKPPKQTK